MDVVAQGGSKSQDFEKGMIFIVDIMRVFSYFSGRLFLGTEIWF